VRERVWIAKDAKGRERHETKARRREGVRERVWIAKDAKGRERHETKARRRESEGAKAKAQKRKRERAAVKYTKVATV